MNVELNQEEGTLLLSLLKKNLSNEDMVSLGKTVAEQLNSCAACYVIACGNEFVVSGDQRLEFSPEDRLRAVLTAVVMGRVSGENFKVIKASERVGVDWNQAGEAQCVVFDHANQMRKHLTHLM